MKSMTSLPLFTLVTSGPTRHNLFARLPELARVLGPIRTPSARTSTRASRMLRGGWAAQTWDDVLSAQFVVLQHPGPRLYEEMGALPARDWAGRTLVVCEGDGETRALAKLESLGAAIVHLQLVDPRDPVVALSGDGKAIARLRRVLMKYRLRCLVIRDGAGPALLAAIRDLEDAIMAAVRESDQALRWSGLRGAEARFVALASAFRVLRC